MTSSAASASSSCSSSGSSSGISTSSSANDMITEEHFRDYMTAALDQIHIPEVPKATPDQIQEWSAFIYNSMNTPHRLYHNADHVIEVLGYLEEQQDSKPDPISVLAVLFHDVVYYTLDKRFTFEQSVLLAGVLEEEPNGSLILSPSKENPILEMVCYIFQRDFVAEKTLNPTAAGLNEFLSALVAVQILKEVLEMEQLLQLVVAIEVTIPFQPSISKHLLWQRTTDVYMASIANGDQAYLKQAEQFATKCLQQAIAVAHSDLGNCACHDPIHVIDSSWRILPEWTPKLMTLHQQLPTSDATIADLLHAFIFARNFPFDTSKIFPFFHGYPDESILNAKQDRANTVLEFSRNYLAIRSLTLHMIEELAYILASISSPQENVNTQIPLTKLAEIEHAATADDDGDSSNHLNEYGSRSKGLDFQEEVKTDCNANTTRNKGNHKKDGAFNTNVLLQVLREGRSVDYAWDPKASPLGGSLFEELHESTELVKEHLLQHGKVQDKAKWLKTLPPTTVQKAIKGVVAIMVGVNGGEELQQKLAELAVGSSSVACGPTV